MSDGFEVAIRGLDEAIETLRGVPPKLAKRVILNSLRKAMRLVRDIARANRGSSGSPATGNPISQYRRHGVVTAAISVRSSVRDRRAGDLGVFVNVRPLPPAQASAHNPDDPFYWRWLEFGTKYAAAKPFLVPAALHLADALQIFEDDLGPQIMRLELNPKDPL